MKITLSPSIIKIANKFSKIPGVKKLLKPFYYRYKERINHNRNEQFKNNGISLLKLFDKIMVENNIPYTVFAGTLLGAVREHGFIAHDMDIDTAIFYEDRPSNLIDLMQVHGFILHHRFANNGGSIGLEETYIKDNVTLDIFYIHKDDHNETYQCDFHPELGTITWEDSMKKYGYVRSRKLQLPANHSFIRLPFAEITVSAISNHDEWLSCRYGQNYMIPDPNFCDRGSNPHIVEEWLEADYKLF